MKTVCYLVVLWLVSHVGRAGETPGVHFSTGTWQEVLSQAKALNKPIFLDFYTTWCGPCKRMEQEAFGQPGVGEMFNRHFINYKVDAEKGQGVALAKQFEVAVYPTIVFVRADQQVIYRTIGFEDSQWLKTEAQKVIDLTAQFNQLTTTKAVNLDDSQQVKAYLKTFAILRQPAGDILDRYLAGLMPPERLSSENLAIMAGTVASTTSLAFSILLEQLPRIKESSVGREALITLPGAVARDFKQVVETNDEQAFEALMRKNEALLTQAGLLAPEGVKQASLQQRMDFYRLSKRTEQYHQLARFYAQTQLLSQPLDSLRKQDQRIYQDFNSHVVASDSLRQTAYFKGMSEAMKHRASGAVSDKLNQLAWSHYESVSNPAHLQVAMQWVKQALALYPEALYRSTHAHLLYKLDHKKAALKEQARAIQQAQAMGQETMALRTTLESMRKRTL